MKQKHVALVAACVLVGDLESQLAQVTKTVEKLRDVAAEVGRCSAGFPSASARSRLARAGADCRALEEQHRDVLGEVALLRESPEARGDERRVAAVVAGLEVLAGEERSKLVMRRLGRIATEIVGSADSPRVVAPADSLRTTDNAIYYDMDT